MPTIDFEQDAQDSISSVNDAKELSDQILKLQSIEDAILATEEQLKSLKKQKDHLGGEVIPEMMQEMNIKTMKLADGSAVEVKPVYGASIPVAKKEEAFNWLRENGLGDIIKNNVVVSFGRDEDDKATAYSDLAKQSGYEPAQSMKVEPQTLKAVLRERLEKGEEVPSDIFNLFVGNQTKITRK